MNWFRRLFRRKTLENQLDRELQFHLERQTADNLRSGMAPANAAREAHLKLGGLEQTKEQCRDARGTLWLESVLQDLRFALRSLAKTPGFTCAAVLALALGIGANTAIFSVVNAVLLDPLPFQSLRDPGRLVMLWGKNPLMTLFPSGRLPVLLPTYRSWQDNSHSFGGMAFYQGSSFDLTAGHGVSNPHPEHVNGAALSSEFLPLLGLHLQFGRNFTAAETQPGEGQVAILTYPLYLRRFAGDTHILGRMLYTQKENYRIIGVLPRNFKLPATMEGFDQPDPEIFVPANLHPGQAAEQNSSGLVYARLRPGVSLAHAQQEMSALCTRQRKSNPGQFTNTDTMVIPLKREDVGPALRRSLLVLQVAVGFVLLIACANVANLLLTRAIKREKEIAVRLALGAGRFRLVRQLITESLLLSFAATGVGLLLAYWSLQAISHFSPEDTHGFHELRLDPLVLAFTCLLALFSGILFGLAPSFHALGQQLNDVLSRTARSVGGSSNRLRGALVILEVALSLILLIGAGLMIRSLSALTSTDLGFRTDHLLTLQLSLAPNRYPKPEQIASFNRELLTSIRSVPGVVSAALTTGLPMRSTNVSTYRIEGGTMKRGEWITSNWVRASQDYFRTLRIPLLRGRAFERPDMQAAAPPVALVNQSFASANWPHQNPLGHIILFDDETGKQARFSIAGVVGNESQMGPDAPANPEFYLPGRQLPNFILVARTAADPLSVVPALEARIWQIDPDQPITNIHSMDEVFHDWTAPRRFNTTILLNFAALALLLAALGLYSVLAYSVKLRTREIGIRVALGAQPKDVVSYVVGQGFRFTLIGIAIGVCGALALTRFLQNLLFGISPTDPATFVCLPILLLAVALAASYWPARQAARIDPADALRLD